MPHPQALTSVHIHGFKSLRDASLDLKPLNVLVGPNGAGKSNLVQVFALLGALIEERLSRFVALSGGASQLLHGGPKETDEIELRLQFGANGYSAVLGLAPGDQLVFLRETCWFHDKTKYERPYELTVFPQVTESGLPRMAREEGKTFRWVAESLRAYRAFHFHDTSRTATVKQKSSIADNRGLAPDAGNLAAYLFRLAQTHPAIYGEIVGAIRMVAPFFGGFDLRPDALDSNRIQLEWKQEGSDQYFNAHSLSDGTLRFMCLATLLLSPDAPLTIVLDEPELGLHPYAIRQLAALIRMASQDRQVLVATQSVSLVDEFEVEDVVVADRERGATTFRRLNASALAEWLDHYSVGELWDKNLLGGRPRHESSRQ